MKTKKNTRKIWAAVLIVALFLISSMVPVNAGLTETAEEKPIPILDKAHSNNNILSAANNDLNLIGMQREQSQSQLQPQQQPSQPVAKKYAVIMVGRYSGPTILSYLTNITAFLKQANQSYVWFLDAAGMMYNTLHDTYGYDEDNIFLLVHMLPVITYQGKTYFNTIPTTFNTNWLNYNSTYDSTKENLETVLSTFNPDGENKLTENDQLFICFIGHGGNENLDYIHGICNGSFYDYEFVAPDSYENTNWFLRSEIKAYDHIHGKQDSSRTYNTDTYAVYNMPTGGKKWSGDLILKTNETKTVKGFRINARKDSKLSQMNITFYNDNAEVKTVILDDWPDQGYKYVEFEDETIQINKVKISFYDNDTKGFLFHPAKVYDFNLWLSGFGCGEIGQTYFGCPFITIPEYLRYLWSIIWGGYSSTEKLYDYELSSYTDGIKAKIIYALQPCMSGGFISELSGSNRSIVCTASRGCELAEAPWIGLFTQALNKIDEDQNGIPDADYNNDGNISILEAYRYTAEKVKNYLITHPKFPPQHPLIDDNGDYVGHHFSETDYYDPNDQTKDGYLAAHTSL